MRMKESKIQRVEITDIARGLFCPFCGARALPPAAELGQVAFEPCEHVLFIAHDLEFEYRASRFDRLMNIEDVGGDELVLPDEGGFDGFTDGTPLSAAVKFAIYAGPPSFYGAYIGFAPAEES
jgi:hypothetical protein